MTKLFHIIAAVGTTLLMAAILLGPPLFASGFIPPGGHAAQREAYARLDAAHARGDHRAVVDIYRSRVDVPWRRDLELYRMEGRQRYKPAPDHLHLTLGDAHRHLGNEAEARSHYLRVMEWSEAKYQSWCRLNDGCPPLHEMARAGLSP